MEKNTEIKYTESGLIELEKFQKNQIKKLEQEILKTKLFPGADYVEVTASDIRDAERKFTVISRTKSEMLQTLVFAYLTIGVLTFFGGIYYSDIERIIKDDSTQGVLILLGLTTMLFSGLLYFVVRQREKKNKYLIETAFKVDRQIEKQMTIDNDRLEEVRQSLLKELEERLRKLKAD